MKIIGLDGRTVAMPPISRVTWIWIGCAFTFTVISCFGRGTAIDIDDAFRSVAFIWFLLVIVMTWCKFRPTVRSLAAPLECFVQLIAISVICLFMQYPAAETGRSLIDPALAAVDRTFYFDWPACFVWVVGHPIAYAILGTVYRSLGWQAFLVCVVAWRQPERASVFVAANALTLTFCLLVFAAWPAGGAFAYYRPTGVVSNYVIQLMTVRAVRPATLSLGHMTGIIQFPSYHAAAAVLFAYLFTALPYWIAIPALVIEIALAVSAVPIGGHHLIDVLAGIAVAGVSLLMTRIYARGAGSTHFGPALGIELSNVRRTARAR